MLKVRKQNSGFVVIVKRNFNYIQTNDIKYLEQNSIFLIIFSTIMTVLITDKLIRVMSSDRTMYKCTCADCKKETEVPFEPKADRPVYCKECYQKHQK